MKYVVAVEKSLYAEGNVKVDAESAEQAEQKVNDMLRTQDGVYRMLENTAFTILPDEEECELFFVAGVRCADEAS